MTLSDVLQDFAFLSVLLIIGFILRKKIKIFQMALIPSAIIAGVIGMLLGPDWLGQISPIYIPFTDSLSQWAGVLVCVVGSTLLLGVDLGKTSRSGLVCGVIGMNTLQIQLLIGIGIAALLGATVFPNLPFGSGQLGFYGFFLGHGNAATAGNIIVEAGLWDDALGVAMTYATIGLLCGVIGGVIIINIASRKGWTQKSMKLSDLSKSELTGYIEPEDRTEIGKGVTASNSVDPLAFGCATIGTVIAIAWCVRKFLLVYFPNAASNVPLSVCVIVMSLVANVFLHKTGLIKYLDMNVMRRISGTALEFMIVASLATTNISVFVNYGIPILITSVVMLIATIIFSLGFAHRWCDQDWFEVGIGCYGQATGVTATGLLLIRIVDPDNETSAAAALNIANPICNFYMLPWLLIGTTAAFTASRVFTVVAIIVMIILLAVGEIAFGGRKRKERRAKA